MREGFEKYKSCAKKCEIGGIREEYNLGKKDDLAYSKSIKAEEKAGRSMSFEKYKT